MSRRIFILKGVSFRKKEKISEIIWWTPPDLQASTQPKLHVENSALQLGRELCPQDQQGESRVQD